MTDRQSKAEIFAKLPADIQAFLKQKATPAIAIDVTRAKQPLGLTSSKFGGLPYIAPDADCPRDEKGYPYQLLVQLNFAEIAEQIGQHPELPTHGLFQLFTPCYDSENFVVEDTQQTRFFSVLPDAGQVNNTVLTELQEWNNDLMTLDFKNAGKLYSEQRKSFEEAFARKYDRYSVAPMLPFYVECALSFSWETVYPCDNDEIEKTSSLLSKYTISEQYAEICEQYINFVSREEGKQYLLAYPPGFMQGDVRYQIYYPNHPPESLKMYEIGFEGSDTLLRTDWRQFLEFSTVYDQSGTPLIDWWPCYHFMIEKERVKNHDFSEIIAYFNVD